MAEHEAQRQFVRYAFYHVDPAWRRLDADQRAADKREFATVVDDEAEHTLIRTFSTVGMRGDVDFLIWTIAWDLETIQRFTARLWNTGLGRYLTTPQSYLATTRHSLYIRTRNAEQEASRTRIVPGSAKYLFVYPFVKTHDWYRLSQRVRQAMMNEHIVIGNKYPGVKINTTYSYGIDDQEFVVAFETDNPSEFVDLVEEYRFSEARPYTLRDTPALTGIQGTIEEVLDTLGG